LQSDELVGATIISFSAGGCAIRTTMHLKNYEKMLMKIQVTVRDQPELLEVQGMVVWGHDDYRIDSFYRHGLKFERPLDEKVVALVVTAGTQAHHLRGPRPPHLTNLA
jgi:hypothetical protein